MKNSFHECAFKTTSKFVGLGETKVNAKMVQNFVVLPSLCNVRHLCLSEVVMMRGAQSAEITFPRRAKMGEPPRQGPLLETWLPMCESDTSSWHLSYRTLTICPLSLYNHK